MDKSYVSMEKRVCEVCGKEYETGSLLMDKRLRDSMEKYTLTGYGMCEEHQKLADDDFIALIEITNVPEDPDQQNMKREEAFRTGNVAHIKKEVFGKVFDVEEPKTPICFVQIGVISKLQELTGDDN